jgi:uncharacterized membrane protein
MNKKRTFNLVLTSVIAAIIVIFSVIPNVGYIIIPGGISIALVIIPVLIGISILPFWYALFIGVFFGGFSLIASLLYAVSPADLAFQNPLISILPRVLFALIAFLIIKGFKFISDKINVKSNFVFFIFTAIAVTVAVTIILVNLIENLKLNGPITVGIGAFCLSILIFGIYLLFTKQEGNKYNHIIVSFFLSTICHTILVLSALYIFADKSIFGGVTFFPFILGIVGTNGIIEAFASSIIGVPLYIASQRLKERYDTTH